MAQIQAKFFTNQEKYAVSEVPFSVLGSTTVDQLNELINQLLPEQDAEDVQSQKKFNFLVHGELLRTALLDHISEHGLSVESVIPVEYFEAQDTPELQQTISEHDWVSGVKLEDQFILAGSYDCSVSVWSRSNGKKLATGAAHTEPVKSVAWVHSKDSDDYNVLSASQDQTIILWNYQPDKQQLKPAFCCKGHSKSVECVAVHGSCEKFVSGSWDCTIKLWSTSSTAEPNTVEEDYAQGLSRKKRLKVEQTGLRRLPKLTMSGHNEAVSGLVWLDQHELCSCSWDHTLRLWDVEEGTQKSQLRGMKAILALDYSPLNGTVVTGNTDRHVRLWDPRNTEATIVKGNLTSHNGWVTCVKWSKRNSNLLVTGSFDNLVKIWDIRSSKTPLFDLDAHEDRVMCVDWYDSEVIASGGADNKVFTFSASDGNVQQTLE